MSGTVVMVTRQPGGPSKAAAKVSLDYSFLGSSQADLGSRLRWVSLPACAMTTPELPQCQVQTPVATTNDYRGRKLVASLPELVAAPSAVSPSMPATGPATAPETAPQTAPETAPEARVEAAGGASQVVLAAVAGPSGPSGDFTATPLKAAGSWSAGGSSGAFTWNYPLTLPKAGYGEAVAPQVGFGYSSGTVDGQLPGSNNQSGWVGEGWTYSAGFVERTYRTCAADKSLPAVRQTGDLCWAGELLTFSLGGRSNTVVKDDTTGEYHLEGDDGSKFERLTGASNSVFEGEYWRLTDLNGVKYYFGRNVLPGGTAAQMTNSVNGARVYGGKPGDRCYSATSFAASRCLQAWRWNLDMVEDPRGNVTIYNYVKETNYYDAASGTSPQTYTRWGYTNASYPVSIQYGIVGAANAYATQPAGQVVFTSAERCIPSSGFDCAEAKFTAANAANWPDTPQDQACGSTGACANKAPSYWSRKRLTQVQAQYRTSSGWTTADTWTLAQSFPTTGDAQMQLDSITRTGNATTGASPAGVVSVPAVQFGYAAYNNRVETSNGQPQMVRKRLTQVRTETGLKITVFYNTDTGQTGRALPLCTGSTLPSDLSANATECFPVKWAPPYYTTPITDWFHKYVVTQVTTSATSGASVPDRLTVYNYSGGTAWRYDENEVIKPDNRTWGQWRGYAQVETRTGSPAAGWTLTRDTYFRGMNGNKTGTGTRAVSVTDTQGVARVDEDQYAGTVLESQTFNGSARVSSVITVPVTVRTTATRARTGLPALKAYVLGTARETTYRTVAGSATPQTISKDWTYNALGQQTSELTTSTGPGTPIAPSCEVTSYATNQTTAWISKPAEVTTAGQATCDPAAPLTGTITGRARTLFDGSPTLGVMGTRGEATTLLAATKDKDTFAKSTTSYDAVGRVTSTTAYPTAAATTGRTTTTTYSATGLPLTSVAVTSPLGSGTGTTTQTLEPAHGQVIKVVDVAGLVTTAKYDALGRLTGVWRPAQQSDTNPTVAYAYTLSVTAPSTVTTTTLVAPTASTRTFTKQVELYNAYGELQQTQSDAADSGSMITDQAFDPHGWVTTRQNGYYVTGAPTTTVVVPSNVANINHRTVTTYDLAGRDTRTDLYNGTALTSSTTTVYGGDRVTVLPPTGATATTTVVNVLDQPTSVLQWSVRPTFTGDTYTGGSAVTATYGYDSAGRNTVMSNAGTSYTTTYDLSDRVVAKTDPDTGASSSVFNDYGELVSSTDARGVTVTNSYDGSGRLIGQASGASPLTKFVYDTLKPGLLTSSSRIVGSTEYRSSVTGYDGAGRATGSTIATITAGSTVSSYTSGSSWSPTGLLLTTTLPAAGAAPTETLTYGYTSKGLPTSLTGVEGSVTRRYVSEVQYDHDGVTQRHTVNAVPGGAGAGYLLDALDPQTRAVTSRALFIGNAVADDVNSTYDVAGNLVKSVHTQGAAGAARSTTCYRYNGLRQLSSAWTSATADSCVTDPASVSGSGAGVVGGPQPWWQSWSYDLQGRRASVVAHQLPAGVVPVAAGNVLTPTSGDTVTSYTYGDAGHVHGFTSASVVTGVNPAGGPGLPGGGSRSRSQVFDAAGNVTSRVTDSGAQTLAWDPLGKVASVTTGAGSTTFVNDSGGNPLVETTAAGDSTMYLGSQEVTSRGGVVSGVRRFYGIGGRSIASRTITAGSVGGPVFMGSNTQGTATVSWDPAAPVGGQVRRQFLDPFGVNLGVGGIGNPLVGGSLSTGGFGTGHAFLEKPANPDTGVVSVGARKYDPVNGVFLSPDPLLDTADPGAWNAYNYTAGNPVTFSDASGLYAKYDDGGGVGSQYTTGNGDWSGATGSTTTRTYQRPPASQKPRARSTTTGSTASNYYGGKSRDGYLHGGSAAQFLKPSGPRTGFEKFDTAWMPRPKPVQVLRLGGDLASELTPGKPGFWDFTKQYVINLTGYAVGGRGAARAGRVVVLGEEATKVTALDAAAFSGGRAANGADNVVNGTRLGQQLARESADSVFTSSGRLSSGAIADSRQIIPGSRLGNKDLIQRLTSDGSDIADWGKYTTRTHQSPSGDFQVHFYMNRSTGAIDYGYDYKIIFKGAR